VNIAAAVCDALEGIYYYNDRQVCDVSARQTWGEEHLTTISVAQYAGGDRLLSVQDAERG
jgi:Holliday junction resolvase RusA-like endonuclease